ncbi:hypothetical protein ACW6QP_01210 [Salegentibacter sp. HM20]
MKQVHENSTIECLSAQIISRKIVPSSFIEIDSVGRCFTYKCYRNSEAVILSELTPLKPKYNKHSNLKEGDILECDQLFIAVNKNRPYTPDLINHTSRHKAQLMKTKEYTMAKISKRIFNIPELIPPKKINKVVKKS